MSGEENLDQPQSDPPQWDRLPDDPVGFFGLAPGFDRKDLKRAYARRIKVYKPERHPAEFQAIRAAYDTLDARLRFGIGSERAFDAPFGGATEPLLDAPAADITPGALTPQRSATEERQRLAEMVREHGAEAARDTLRAALDRGEAAWSGAWTALALLEDELEGESDERFYAALVEGYAKTQGDVATQSLLARLLREDLPAERAAKLVQDLAEATGPHGGPPPAYWFLTERLWIQLARTVQFESFARLLNACANHVGEEGRAGQLVLLVKLRRVAIFRASEDWLAEVDREFEDSARMLPSWLESEIDLAQWLSGYRFLRPTFVDGSEIRDVIDEAIVAAIEQDEVDADRAFLDAQLTAIDRPEEWMQSLRDDVSASEVAHGYMLWYGHVWRERRGIDDEDVLPTAKTRALEFTRRLDRRSGRTMLSRVWNYSLLFWMLAIVVIFGVISELFEPQLGKAAPLLPIGAIVLLLVGFFRGWWWKPIEFYSRPFARRQHRKVWRPMTAAFLEESRLPFGTLVEVLCGPKAATGHFEAAAIAEDIGLASYAEALRNVVE